MANRIKTVLEMIKFEHSVFALPFAIAPSVPIEHGITTIASTA